MSKTTSRTELMAFNTRLKEEFYTLRKGLKQSREELDILISEIQKHKQEFEDVLQYQKTIWFNLWFFFRYQLFRKK